MQPDPQTLPLCGGEKSRSGKDLQTKAGSVYSSAGPVGLCVSVCTREAAYPALLGLCLQKKLSGGAMKKNLHTHKDCLFFLLGLWVGLINAAR